MRFKSFSAYPISILFFYHKLASLSVLHYCHALISLKAIYSNALSSVSSNLYSRRPPSSATIPKTRAELLSNLQNNKDCLQSPYNLLHQIGCHVTQRVDLDGSLASLVMVRLMKQLVALDNDNRDQASATNNSLFDNKWSPSLSLLSSFTADNLVQAQEETNSSICILNQLLQHAAKTTFQPLLCDLEALVTLTKATSVIARVLVATKTDVIGVAQGLPLSIVMPLIDCWHTACRAEPLKPHQLSGLKWCYDTFQLVYPNDKDSILLPTFLQKSYDHLQLPFRVVPGSFASYSDLSVAKLADQVDFAVDDIQTQSNLIVTERRQTAWQGDEGVNAFHYAGKSMPRKTWSPLVRDIRDNLYNDTNIFYDCCLLNLYPDGCSGMRYHTDPDQGHLWGYDTAVVSVGATRQFCFRAIESNKKQSPHTFHVMHGDVVQMFNDCQIRFQHTVRKAERKNENVTRASLVFKQDITHLY